MYGIYNGGDRKSEEAKSERNNYVLIKTQEELAAHEVTGNNYRLAKVLELNNSAGATYQDRIIRF